MLFHEVSSGGSEAASEVVGLVRTEAPILEHVHFFVEPGGSAVLDKDANIASSAGFRALNSDYSTKDQGDPAYASFALKIFGKTLKVDRAYERRGLTRGGSDAIASQLTRQRRAFARNLGRNLNRYMITGSSEVSALQFNGVLKAVDGLADSQTLDALGENGTQILTGNTDAAKKSQQKFVEALGFLIASVAGGASVLLMNSKLIARLSTIARDNVSTTVDEFGRTIKTFDGVPIVPVGYDYDSTELLPFSATVGTSTDCSTVCALRSEEAAYWSFMTTPGGLWVSEVQLVGNFYEQTVEFQLDSGEPFNARSLAILPGVRLG
jgi:hypothetical protein